MKKSILLAFATIISATWLSCRAESHEPAVKWLKTVHDFGAFDEADELMTTEFKFVNQTDSDVMIVQVAANCGCTVPSYKRDAIHPGDTASIHVSYNPTGRPGRFEKQIFVRTTASHERDKLSVKGVVMGKRSTIADRYPADMGPLRLHNGAAMLGRVPHGKAKSEFIDGYNASYDTLRPKFTNVPKYLQVKCTPEAIPPGDLVSINLYFRGDRCKEWGIVTDSITITPRVGGRSYTLPVVAIIEEDFSQLTAEQKAKAPRLALVGDRIDLGKVDRDVVKPVTAKMQLMNRGEKPLKIRRVYSQDPAVKVSVKNNEVKTGKMTDLIVTFDPTKHTGNVIDTRVTLITNDPTAPTRTLRVVGLR